MTSKKVRAIAGYIPLAAWPPGKATQPVTSFDLVQAFDRLLTNWAWNEGLPPLVFAAETTFLEQYLTLRPQQRAVVERLATAGRLLMSPDYGLSRPTYMSGEAVVRSLMLGRQKYQEQNLWHDAAYLAQHPYSAPRQHTAVLYDFGYTKLITPADVWRIHTLDGDVSNLNEAVVYCVPLEEKTSTHPNVEEAAVSFIDADSHSIFSSELLSIEALLASRIKPFGEAPSAAANAARSDRMPLKQHYYAAVNQLKDYLEPLSVWLSTNAAAEAASLVDINRVMWQRLFNVGQTGDVWNALTDPAAEKIEHQLEGMAAELSLMAKQYLGLCVTSLADAQLSEGFYPTLVSVYNPTPSEQTVALTLQGMSAGDFMLVDEHGQQAKAATLHHHADDQGDSHRITTAGAGRSAASLRFLAEAVPAFGFRSYRVETASGVEPPASITDDGSSIENEYFSLEVDRESGSVTIFDKQTGRLYTDLHRFVDGGDAGDLNAYREPEQDMLLTLPANSPIPVMRWIDSVSQSLQVLYIYRLPEGLNADQSARLPLSAQFVPVSILVSFELLPGRPLVDVSAQIANNARDHRLRLHFSTGVYAQQGWLDGYFEVQQVPVDGRLHHLRTFASVQGDESGLTIAARGLPEAAFIPGRDGAEIALTMLRSVGYWQQADGQVERVPKAQLIRNVSAHYSIIPHGPALSEAWRLARAAVGVPIAHLHHGQVSRVPSAASLVSCSTPDFVITAVKLWEHGQGMIVRGCNLSGQPLKVDLHMHRPYSSTYLAALDEHKLNEQPVEKAGPDVYRLTAAPHQIVTLLFEG